jgi:hypothetical protein
MMEPDHVNETSSHDFTPVAAGGDIRNGPRGLDHLGQELLAEWGQAERASQNGWFAKRLEFCVRVRPGGVTFAALDEYEWRWIRMALSGRPEISGDAHWRPVTRKMRVGQNVGGSAAAAFWPGLKRKRVADSIDVRNPFDVRAQNGKIGFVFR